MNQQEQDHSDTHSSRPEPIPLQTGDAHLNPPTPTARRLELLNREFTKYTEGTAKYSGDELLYQTWERTIKKKVEHWEKSELLSDFVKLNYAQGTLEGRALLWLYETEDNAKESNTTAFSTLEEFLALTTLEFDIKNKVDKAFNYLWSLKPVALKITPFLDVFNVHIANVKNLCDKFVLRLFLQGLHPILVAKIKHAMSGKPETFQIVKALAHTAQTEHDHDVTAHVTPLSKRAKGLDSSGKMSAIGDVAISSPACIRCGRNNHKTEDCVAKTRFKSKRDHEALPGNLPL